MIRRRLLVLASVFLFVLPSALRSQTVAFVGGDFTYTWQQSPAFQAHSNWQAYGLNVDPTIGPCHEVGSVTPVVQQIIASGKKPIVVVLAGQQDSDFVAPGVQPNLVFASFATDMVEIIQKAQAATLTLVVGTIPLNDIGDIQPYNKWLLIYCAEHNVPTSNFEHALNHSYAYTSTPLVANNGDGSVLPSRIVTSAGYDVMTDMALTQIGLTAGTFKLTSGYLNVTSYSGDGDSGINQINVNGKTTANGGQVWVTAWGTYSDGKHRILNNANKDDLIGTFSNSAQNVAYIDQQGYGRTLEPGSTNFRFVTFDGRHLDPIR